MAQLAQTGANSSFIVSHVINQAGTISPWFSVAYPASGGFRCAFCGSGVVWRREAHWRTSGAKKASEHFAHRAGAACGVEPTLAAIGGPGPLHEHFVSAFIQLLASRRESLAAALDRDGVVLPTGAVDRDLPAPGGSYRPDVGIHPGPGTAESFLGVEIVNTHAPEIGRRMQAELLNHIGIAFDVTDGVKAYVADICNGQDVLEAACVFLRRKGGFKVISRARFDIAYILRWIPNLNVEDLAARSCSELSTLALQAAGEHRLFDDEQERKREVEAELRWQAELVEIAKRQQAFEAARTLDDVRRREREDRLAEDAANAKLEADRLLQQREALLAADPGNQWLMGVAAKYAGDPAAHEAEMLRTALAHQAEFQRTGKRTQFGDQLA